MLTVIKTLIPYVEINQSTQTTVKDLSFIKLLLDSVWLEELFGACLKGNEKQPHTYIRDCILFCWPKIGSALFFPHLK